MRLKNFDAAFFDGLDRLMGSVVADSFHAAVHALKEISRVTKRIENGEKPFRQHLAQAVETLKKVMRNSDNDSGLLLLTAKANARINAAIMGIRALISEANEAVNGVNIDRLSCPARVIELFGTFNGILPRNAGRGHYTFRLSELREIQVVANDPEMSDAFHFVCRYRRDVEAFFEEVDQFRTGVDAFNEWIHDMGHYLVQIDKLLPNRTDNDVQIMKSDAHTLDGLLSGVRLLKVGLQMSLHGDDITVSLRDEKKSHPYEPYKVFHKLRYCFDDKGVIWKEGERKFWGKVAPACGIEFAAMNLYSNAVKYLEHFQGEKIISTFFNQREDGLEILVESYGPLVDEGELNKISHQVFRASSASRYKGSGRGLWRVRKICEAAGYDFQVYTKKGKAQKWGFAPFVARILIPKHLQIFDKSCFNG